MPHPITDPLQGQWCQVDGLKTFYVQEGAGPAVVLLHGAAPGSCALVTWHPTIGPLSRTGFTIFAFDQPGFGYTEIPEDHSVEYRVRHARTFLDTVVVPACERAAAGAGGAAGAGPPRFYLVGNSAGAYLAARLALDDSRVERLVLVGSSTLAPRGSDEAAARARRHARELDTFEPTLASVREMTAGTLFNPHRVTEELVQARLAMSSGPRHQAHLQRRRAPSPPPLGEALSRLRMPVLIVWGRNDRGAAVERALLLQEQIPGAELHVFDRCAHWVQWDQPDRFNRVVADFLTAPWNGRASGPADAPAL